MRATEKPLRADVFDTLEFMALAFGGVGAGPLYGTKASIYGFAPTDFNCPNCAHGLLLASEGDRTPISGGYVASSEISWALAIAGVDGIDSDDAVRAINQRKGKKGKALDDRVTFSAWRRQTGIVRADA